MHDRMTILKADHREVKQMLTKLADSDEGSEREALAAKLAKALTAHMELEERLVYPLVENEIGEEDFEEANIEHGLARDGLATLMSMVDKPGFGASVEMLKGGIAHHVEEEENELLPELKEKLARDEWLALGDAIAEGKTAAGIPALPPARRKSSKRKSSTKAGANSK